MGFADRWVWAVWEEKVGTKAKEYHQTLTSPLNSPCLLPGDASLTNGNTFPSVKMPAHGTELERQLMVRAHKDLSEFASTPTSGSRLPATPAPGVLMPLAC